MIIHITTAYYESEGMGDPIIYALHGDGSLWWSYINVDNPGKLEWKKCNQ